MGVFYMALCTLYFSQPSKPPKSKWLLIAIPITNLAADHTARVTHFLQAAGSRQLGSPGPGSRHKAQRRVCLCFVYMNFEVGAWCLVLGVRCLGVGVSVSVSASVGCGLWVHSQRDCDCEYGIVGCGFGFVRVCVFVK